MAFNDRVPSLRRVLAFVVLSVCVLSPALSAQEPADRDVKSRLNAMMAQLERQREELHVPGLGIAVVYNDEVILCDGLGFADLEKQTKATGDTVFAIGSSTKAFTATLIGMLADEGKMSYDDHVREHLPRFHLFDKEADEKVTLRDVLSHRSGLCRMSFLWATNALSRDEVLAAVADAEPTHAFGSEFNYCNINFIIAGQSAASAAGMEWESLMRERLLEPLEMSSATLSAREAAQQPNLATGYTWDDVDGTFIVEPMRDVSVVGPAGSVNASACEMANWLRLQLGRGVFEGRRLISEKNLTETWQPQISIAPGVSYGLGWMVRTHNGRRLIEHGGNIDGFGAQVAFLPDENIGYVLLTNNTFSPLQGAANAIVFDTLLDAPSADEGDGATEREDFSAYLGEYIANFAHFKGDRFTVQLKNGNLAVDVPGQTAYELKPPDEEGKRAFVMTDQIAVSFDRNEAGQVIGMKMYQNGLTFELPREGVTVEGDVTHDEVRELLGTYRFEAMNADLTVLMQNGRLAVDVPGQMVYELHPPDDEGRWVFRARDTIMVAFNHGDDGDVESMTMWQDGAEFTMPRTGSPDPAMTATLDEVMALKQQAMGGNHLDEIETLHLAGSLHFVNQGVRGTVDTLARGLSHYQSLMDLGRCGRILIVIAGDEGWTASSFDTSQPLKGKYLGANARLHPLLPAVDWTRSDAETTLLGIRTFDGRPHYAVEVKVKNVFKSTAYIDVASGLVSGEELLMAARGVGILGIDARYTSYRNVAGVMLPSRLEVEDDFHGTSIIEYDVMEANVELPDGAFAEPPAQLE